MDETSLGTIVVLNGAPRSGKSSIARAMQWRLEGVWMNLGVDAWVRQVTPERFRPGIGLRPGGERPDLEAMLPVMYAALYESVAAHSRLGLNVVIDVGHHDAYSRPLGILAECAGRLDGLPAYLVGVRCPIEEIMRRRNGGQAGREGDYLTGLDGTIPAPVLRWQSEVHVPGIYDLEVDTSVLSPDGCTDAIAAMMATAAPTAFERLRAGDAL